MNKNHSNSPREPVRMPLRKSQTLQFQLVYLVKIGRKTAEPIYWPRFNRKYSAKKLFTITYAKSNFLKVIKTNAKIKAHP